MEVEKVTEHRDGSATITFNACEEEFDLFELAVKSKKPLFLGDEELVIVKSKLKGVNYELKKKRKNVRKSIAKTKKRN